jgi:hypothetical protein
VIDRAARRLGACTIIQQAHASIALHDDTDGTSEAWCRTMKERFMTHESFESILAVFQNHIRGGCSSFSDGIVRSRRIERSVAAARPPQLEPNVA